MVVYISNDDVLMTKELITSCRSCPEIVVTRTTRIDRLILIALLFIATYLVDYKLKIYHLAIQRQRLHSRGISSSYTNSSLIINNHQQKNDITKSSSKIHIFYNLFTKSAQDEERVQSIIQEQFNLINPKYHNTNVSITSIGYKLSSIPNNVSTITQHYNEGGEDLTLHALWKYCKANNHRNVKVVYLHSKGSYHPNESNHRLRNFVTQGALSTECANLPDTCNVCSSRMSPLPHPHTSGNMWLARCDYISKLIDPLAAKEGKLPSKIHEDNPCKGRGRYLGEHWVHSHPSVKPCDLYPGKEFTWAHLRVPQGNLQKELMKAPRFKFNEYVLPGMCMDKYPETLSSEDFVELRKQNYELLYNITNLDESWWGWEFLKRSMSNR